MRNIKKYSTKIILATTFFASLQMMAMEKQKIVNPELTDDQLNLLNSLINGLNKRIEERKKILVNDRPIFTHEDRCNELRLQKLTAVLYDIRPVSNAGIKGTVMQPNNSPYSFCPKECKHENCHIWSHGFDKFYEQITR